MTIIPRYNILYKNVLTNELKTPEIDHRNMQVMRWHCIKYSTYHFIAVVCAMMLHKIIELMNFTNYK